MKICRVLVTTALLVLVPALAANAAVLFTPLLTSTTTGLTLACSIVNVGTSTENVTMHGISADGFVILTVNLTLPPNQGATFAPPPGRLIQGFCEFIVPDKTSASFRAAIEIGTLSGNTISNVTVALPAF